MFVGGATVALYADTAGTEVRPTDDVDVVVELAHYRDFVKIEEKLRQRGFSNDINSNVICRYKVQGIIVDIMPTSDEVLGFSNPWYKPGFANAIISDLGNGYAIKIFSPPYFLATKLQAFKNRGEGDGRWSTDFEDVVFLLNHRKAIWDEIVASDIDVKILSQ